MSEESLEDRAEDVFLLALADAGPGGPDVESLVARHPDLADELRSQADRWRWLEEVCRADGAAVRDESEHVVARLRRATPQDRYDRGEVLAEGGMARIHRARDRHLERDVAMKVSRRPAADGTARGLRALLRFVAEAHVMGRLDHPGVLPVHDVGVDEEQHPFFTMPLVNGVDLERGIELARAGAADWDLPRVVRTLVAVTETLRAAHATGVLHRDLKPANVMVGSFGEVYVMDWGLARTARDRRAARTEGPEELDSEVSAMATLDGATLGTPYYMAPEQARGELDRVDERSEVYAVGGMLYHALSGRPPHEGASVVGARSAVLAAARSGETAPLPEVAPDAPTPLVAICVRALAARAEDRYPSVAELGADLRRWLEHRPVSAQRTGPWTELVLWVRRNPLAAAGAGLAAVAIAVALVVQVSKRRAVERMFLAVSAAKAEADDAADREARGAYRAALAAVQEQLESGNVREARALLERLPEERRGWEWRFLHARLDTSERRIPAPRVIRADSGGLAFDPTSRRLFLALGSRGIGVVDAESGEELARYPTGLTADVALAPDGARLFGVTNEGRLFCVDPASGLELADPLELGAPLARLAISDSGARIAVAGAKDELWCIDARTGSVAGPVLAGGRVLALAWYGDEELVTVTADGRVERRVGAVLERVAAAALGSGDPTVAAAEFSPDGDRVAVTLGNSILVLGTRDLAPELRFVAHRSMISGLVWDRDLDVLFSASFDGLVAGWDPRDGAPVFRGAGHEGNVTSLVQDPRSGHLWTWGRDTTLRRWSFARNALDSPVWHDTMALGQLDVDATAGRVVTRCWARGPTIWNLDSREPEFTLPLESWSTESAWLAGGDLLALGDEAGEVSLRCAWTGATIARRALLDGPVGRLAAHPERPWIAALSRSGQLVLWRYDTDEVVALPDAEMPGLAFVAGSSSLLVSPTCGELGALDVERGAWEWRATPHRAHPVACFVPAPDGARVASVGYDGRVWIGRTADGGTEASWTFVDASTRAIDWLAVPRSLAFHPTEPRLATGGGDGRLRLWDTRTGDLVLARPRTRSGIGGISFDGSGERLVLCEGPRLWIHATELRPGRPPGFARAWAELSPRAQELWKTVPAPAYIEAELARGTRDSARRSAARFAARLLPANVRWTRDRLRERLDTRTRTVRGDAAEARALARYLDEVGALGAYAWVLEEARADAAAGEER